jgi:hypothetical protein
MDAVSSQIVRRQSAVALLSAAVPAPTPTPVDGMADLLVELESAQTDLGARESARKAIDDQVVAAAAELRSAAADRICPICGSDLDPDQVVETALKTPGTHVHA